MTYVIPNIYFSFYGIIAGKFLFYNRKALVWT